MKKQAMIIGYKGRLFIDGTVGGTPITEGQTEYKLENFTPALLNDPLALSQFGFVMDATKVTSNQEGINLLKSIKKGGDDIGDVDAFFSGSDAVFAWLGGPRFTSLPHDLGGSSSYDSSAIDKIQIVEVEIPEDIVAFATSQDEG